MKTRVLTLLLPALCVLTLAFAAPALAGTATNISNSWKTSTTAVENFNFGNPVTASATSLPIQVQGEITPSDLSKGRINSRFK